MAGCLLDLATAVCVLGGSAALVYGAFLFAPGAGWIVAGAVLVWWARGFFNASRELDS